MKYKTCPECNTESSTVEERRQNTRYTKDELNYVTMCRECFKERGCFEETKQYWKEMWRDVYGY
jgi:hypothetical protein